MNKVQKEDHNTRDFEVSLIAERNVILNQAPEVFCKKSALKIFANVTGKHRCWGLFLRKVTKSATLLKRDSKACVFL